MLSLEDVKHIEEAIIKNHNKNFDLNTNEGKILNAIFILVYSNSDLN